jgi:hypothetical protein
MLKPYVEPSKQTFLRAVKYHKSNFKGDMAQENRTAGLKITPDQMLQMLNEDLAREYQTIIEINNHIDCLNDKPDVMPDSVNTSNIPVEILRAVLENERKMTEHYRERIRQADAVGEFALSETLRAVIAQGHQADLNSASDSNVHPFS